MVAVEPRISGYNALASENERARRVGQRGEELVYRMELLALMRNCPTCWGKTAPVWIGRYPAQTAVALTADWVSLFRQMGQFFISANTHVPHRALQGGAGR